VKLPPPLPRSTVTELDPLFVTITSSLPSPLMSASATPAGELRVGKFWMSENVVSPPRNTETTLLPACATTRSRMLSPVTSPTASADGCGPTCVKYVFPNATGGAGGSPGGGGAGGGRPATSATVSAPAQATM